MTVFLIIVSIVLWTFVCLVWGMAVGKNSVEQLNEGIQGPPGPEGPSGPVGLQGERGLPGKCVCFHEVHELKTDVSDLKSRMSRVERKAGFNV